MPYLSSHPPISGIRILSVQGTFRQLGHEACFLYLLSGEVQARTEDRVTILGGGDILFLEPDQPCELSGRGSNLLLMVHMDYDFYAQSDAGKGLGRLVCNSAQDSERDYSLLRQMLSHLALNYFDHAPSGELRQLELCYALLYYLSTAFYQPGAADLSSERERRGRQILAYIENNYMRDLGLEELAGRFYLSVSHLSRLFKKLTGVGFKTYLQEVRLRHAAADLRRTDQTVTAIAYANGFPNVGALNSALRKAYGMTPGEFRRTPAAESDAPAASDAFTEVDYQSVKADLVQLAGPEPALAAGIYRYPDRLEYRIDDVSRFTPIPELWRSMINVGSIRSLANVGVEGQLRMVQEEIGFRYARLERVLTPESIPRMNGGSYSFTSFDRAIELLLSLKLTPFLDLSLREDYFLLGRSQVVFRGKRAAVPSLGEYLDLVSALLRHCINTFGAGEVEQWGVELCALHDEMLRPLETPEEYAQRFEAVYRLLKEWLPGLRIGGPEMNIALDLSFLERAAGLLRDRGLRFDFLSLCVVPYTPTRDREGEVQFVISSDPDYPKHRVLAALEKMESLGLGDIPLWVTALCPDVSTRNYVNDSCYQAAFFVKTTLDLIGLAEVIGYWHLSDIDTEYTDTTRLLFGGNGILSKDGLKKPGFTALKRLGQGGARMVEKTGRLLMTTGGTNTYQIVLCNYAHFSDEYCLQSGEGVTLENVYTVFGDASTRDVSLELHGLQNGRYKVITTTLNRESGSLFDEWLRYGVFDELQPQDIHYLQDIVHPHRAVRYYDCTDGSLSLAAQMLPHEVKFLLLIREI